MKDETYILIVDDDPRMATACARALRKQRPKWIILEAHSLKDALEVIRDQELDAVVTDWKLNEHNKRENGIEVIKAASIKDPHCVTILFSGFPKEIDRYREAYKAGAYDFISKTTQGIALPKELVVKLDSALERRDSILSSNAFARHIDANLRERYGHDLPDKGLSSRWLTIVFADVRGFSSVTEKLKAHKPVITEFLQELYRRIIEVTHRHGGIVDKFMGDGAMILFGALDTVPQNESATSISAVHASVEIQSTCKPLIEKLKRTAAELEAVQMPDLALGIGINRAEVLVGIIGTEHRDQFTAVGHGVNLAARVENSAGKAYGNRKGKYGNTLLTSTVKSHVEKIFSLRKEPDLTGIRNIDNAHPVWSVVGRKT